MSGEYYNSVVKAIHQEASKSRDKESSFWDVIEGTAGVIDAAADTSFGNGITIGKTIINKARGKVGPASNIMYEIFSRRGATRIFGKYDVDKIIKDPAGWLALNDKLMLI